MNIGYNKIRGRPRSQVGHMGVYDGSTGTSDVLMMKVQRSGSHRPTNAEGSGLRPSILFEEAMEVTVRCIALAGTLTGIRHGSLCPCFRRGKSVPLASRLQKAIVYDLARARPQVHRRRPSMCPRRRGAQGGPELPVAVIPQHPLHGPIHRRQANRALTCHDCKRARGI